MPEQTIIPSAVQGSRNHADTAVSPIKICNMDTYYDRQFAKDVADFRNSGKLQSGYPNIDAITKLYPGLYVIGAVPSLGKTTFIHQMGEQIAESGTHVLFFSFEQSILELASKSIARSIARENTSNRMSSLEIRKSSLLNPDIVSAVERCRAYSGRITIIECSFRATIDDITDIVNGYIEQNKVKPVVIIDYLQVIQPMPESRMTTKDLTDYHVHRLKELQADCQITMIVISSFNRQNYIATADYESFKESGGIEYTADVIWALQLQCITEEDFCKLNTVTAKRKKYKEAKSEIPRKVELVCLKNRFGTSSYSCLFDYYPNLDWFRPDTAELNTNDIGTMNDRTDGFSAVPDDEELPWS